MARRSSFKWIVMILLTAMVLYISYNNQLVHNDIVGRWSSIDGKLRIEFLNDKRVILNYNDSEFIYNYKVLKDSIILKNYKDVEIVSFDYKFNGNDFYFGGEKMRKDSEYKEYY